MRFQEKAIILPHRLHIKQDTRVPRVKKKATTIKNIGKVI